MQTKKELATMWNTFGIYVSSVEKCMYKIFPLELLCWWFSIATAKIREINQIVVSKEQIAAMFTVLQSTRLYEKFLQHLEF